jgi:pyridoxamine 5'-phosphate oxidase
MSDPLDPIVLFLRERDRAIAAGEPWEAAACTLATVAPTGAPSVRFILSKEVDASGFRFYTNRTSRKAQELAAEPRAALAFHFHSIETQFRVDGLVELATDAESDAYFAGRPRISQLGAWASEQSQPLASREVLLARLAALEARFPEGSPVPRPGHWGGYRLVPNRIEHWAQGDFRLHHRTLYEREGARWRQTLLNP